MPNLWSMTVDEMVALPTDALGLLVLQEYVDTNAWNESNWLLLAEQRIGRGDRRLARLADAWAWIKAEALVSRTPGHSTPEALSLISVLGRQSRQRPPKSSVHRGGSVHRRNPCRALGDTIVKPSLPLDGSSVIEQDLSSHAEQPEAKVRLG